MNVKHSFADRLIVQRRGKSLERPPVFGVRPLLVRIQLVEIGHHWIPPFQPASLRPCQEPYPIRAGGIMSCLPFLRSCAPMERATQHELQLASRMSRLGTETAFEVLNKARALERQGKSIIHLEIGEPDFDTPANVIEAGVDALYKGWTHYGPSAGLPDLRQTIAEYVSRTRRVPVTSEEVVVVPGGKPIIFFTILALVNEGDEVIYPNPGFPIYQSMVNYVGGKAIPIHLREERDFSLDVDELAALITDRTRLIILNSTENPTGGVLDRHEIEAIARVI